MGSWHRQLIKNLLDDEFAGLNQSPAAISVAADSKWQSLKQLMDYAKANPGIEPAQLAAWTMLCNQVFNLDEVLNK